MKLGYLEKLCLLPMVNNNRQGMDLMNYNIQKEWQREKKPKDHPREEEMLHDNNKKNIIHVHLYVISFNNKKKNSTSTLNKKIVPKIEQASTSDNKF